MRHLANRVSIGPGPKLLLFGVAFIVAGAICHAVGLVIFGAVLLIGALAAAIASRRPKE